MTNQYQYRYRTVKRYRRLRGALVAAGVDQAGLADILHMSPASVSNRLRGQQPWRLDEMYAILACLDIGKPEAVLGFYFPKDGLDPEVGGCP